MLTIWPFSGWVKGNVAQNNDSFTGSTEGKFVTWRAGCRSFNVFPSSRKPANFSVQKHAKRVRVCILKYKWKRAKQPQAKPSHRIRNWKVKRSNDRSRLLGLQIVFYFQLFLSANVRHTKLLSFPVPVYFYFRFLSNWNFGFSNSNMWRDFKFKLKVSFGILWKIMVALLTIKWLIRVDKVNWSSNHIICILVGMVIWTSTSAISSFPFIVSTCSK